MHRTIDAVFIDERGSGGTERAGARGVQTGPDQHFRPLRSRPHGGTQHFPRYSTEPPLRRGFSCSPKDTLAPFASEHQVPRSLSVPRACKVHVQTRRGASEELGSFASAARSASSWRCEPGGNMSFLAPEEARLCKACDHRWFAEHVQKPTKPMASGGFYALGGHHGAAASAGSTAAVKYQAKLERYNKWKYCPQCGSKSVKSVSKHGFLPTGASASGSATSPSRASAARAQQAAHADPCACGAVLSPAWNFCPMCASPAR